jgi:hypothetical protein
MRRQTGSRVKLTPRLILLGGTVVWIVIIVVLGLPRLREIRERENRIEEISSRLDQLGHWRDAAPQRLYTTAGWDSITSLNYPKYFPRELSVEEYFYQLAGTASRSGVDPIVVQNLDKNRGRGGEGAIITCDFSGDDITALRDRLSTVDLPERSLGLVPYHVNVKFESSYSNLVQFIDKLTEVKRAMSVNKVDLRQVGQQVSVTMELEYYVQAGN